jgi:uncharacterized membrane protein (DUF4010 family)
MGLGVALGCGLLIGIERERSKGAAGSGRKHAYAGMRSFAIAALSGALAKTLDPALVVVGAWLIVLLSAISYWRERASDPGITTELALFLSYLLGVNAIDRPELSGAAAVMVAAMLNLRSRLHHFARVSLTSGELRDALILAGAALVVMPLLPDAGSRALLGVNPQRLWGLVILIMSIQAGAHVALRVAGPRLGLALSGFASGFVSSVATTAAMGARSRSAPALLRACVSAALMSNIATFILLAFVTVTVAPGLLAGMAPLLASGALAAAVVAVLSQRGTHALASSSPESSPESPTESCPESCPVAGHAFSIRQALGFALILGLATALLAYANAHFGQDATRAGAALAGLLDAHAASGSALSLGAGGAISAAEAQLAVLLALSSNTLSKFVAAVLAGGRAYALRVGAGLLPIVLAAWMPYWLAGA